jgi:hypothetical protein
MLRVEKCLAARILQSHGATLLVMREESIRNMRWRFASGPLFGLAVLGSGFSTEDAERAANFESALSAGTGLINFLDSVEPNSRLGQRSSHGDGNCEQRRPINHDAECQKTVRNRGCIFRRVQRETTADCVQLPRTDGVRAGVDGGSIRAWATQPMRKTCPPITRLIRAWPRYRRTALTWLLGLIWTIEREIDRRLNLLVKCFLGESPATHSLLHYAAK